MCHRGIWTISLFGRDWLIRIKLNWESIFSISASDSSLSQEVQQKLNNTIHSFINVFQPGLGITVKGITAKLEMKDGAQPKFCTVRSVQYALQGSVEAEYKRL